MSPDETFDQLIAAARQERDPEQLALYAMQTVRLLEALYEAGVAIQLPLLVEEVAGIRGSLRAWWLLLEARAQEQGHLFPRRHQRR